MQIGMSMTSPVSSVSIRCRSAV